MRDREINTEKLEKPSGCCCFFSLVMLVGVIAIGYWGVRLIVASTVIPRQWTTKHEQEFTTLAENATEKESRDRTFWRSKEHDRILILRRKSTNGAPPTYHYAWDQWAVAEHRATSLDEANVVIFLEFGRGPPNSSFTHDTCHVLVVERATAEILADVELRSERQSGSRRGYGGVYEGWQQQLMAPPLLRNADIF